MRTAVVRVDVDPTGSLSDEQFASGVAMLRERGFEVVATPIEYLPSRGREVELIIAGNDPDRLRDQCVSECADIFGTDAQPGVVTYVSRGTDEDALGVVHGFGLYGEVHRAIEEDGDVVTVTLDQEDLRRVPESRLHTALEAALNCEVRIVTR